MQKNYITKNGEQTKELGRILAQKLRGGEVICMEGELGAGKTTFTQGLLEGLGIEGPYTSPTFVILKKYGLENSKFEIRKPKQIQNSKFKIQNSVYHLDVYRVESQDVLDLGWEEIIADNKNIVIVEWAEKIRDIVPENAVWIRFRWMGENERSIEIK